MTTPVPAHRPAERAPRDIGGERFLMYTAEFAADPHRVYAQMRARHRSLVPVELEPGVPATLVIKWRTARTILHNPDRFPADPRIWQQSISADSTVLPMLEYRENALRSGPEEHPRYRIPTVAAHQAIDLHTLHDIVEDVAVDLINVFCGDGVADLRRQYALPLAFTVLNTLVGCPPDIGAQLARGFAATFDAAAPETVNATIIPALAELIAAKRIQPGDDIATRLVCHPHNLGERELIQVLLTPYAAGIEPLQNLILNTLRLILIDETFGGNLVAGSLATPAAINHVLSTDPPLATLGATYPRTAVVLDDILLPPHQPVLISYTACNTDPDITAADRDLFSDNQSHMGFSIGPHKCPAQNPARLIATGAIDQLLDALPEIKLALPKEQLVWRPSPFHRALEALPVTFPKSPPMTSR